MVYQPITTQSIRAPTTTPAICVPRCDLKRAGDKVEPPALNSDPGNRLFSLLAGNRLYTQHQILSCLLHDETEWLNILYEKCHCPLRFRVTHHDKKLQGGPNPLVGSGDQIDQSQDSEERKESGYNLRNMFKDVRPPSESANGVAPSVGKRRKSLTLFGLRRGSDPAGVKAGEGAGRETGGGGVRFAIQQQPVVLEELSQTENIEVAPERGTQPVAEPENKPKNPQLQAKTVGTGDPLSPQSKIETHDILATEKDSTDGPSPKTAQNPKNKTSFGVSAVSAPSYLPIPLPASPGQAFPTAKNPANAEDAVTENKELYDPGPLQTSTPIAPLHGNNPGLAPFSPTGQPEHYSSKDYPVTQTPPDPSSSQDSEARIGASLALISLGSSPPSSPKVKTPSSVSSLKTPTSPLSVTSIPNSSVGTPSESMKPDISKVPKTEIKRAGILKSPKSSPVEGGSKALVRSSPTDQLPKDKITNLPLSPSSPMGGRISNVTIVKASPDSRREFSVVTMVEEERDQQRETSNLGVESEKADTSPTVLDVGQPPIQQGENSRSQDRPTVSQDKDDMVEMEDIKDCKVTQVEEAKTMDE